MMFRLSNLISCTRVESKRNVVVQRSEMCWTCQPQQQIGTLDNKQAG